MPDDVVINPHVAATKQLRKEIDETLQNLRRSADRNFTGFRDPDFPVRASRERALAITKLQEAAMWLGMDLKAINEEAPGTCPDPYPESRNPNSPRIEPTADGLKL